jgi:hypothetical protein
MLRTKLYLACALAIGIALPAATASAQGPVDQRTYFTFSQAIELPGKTLPAGTYLFKLADSQSNRHIVQVFDKDGKQIHATLLAIPSQRMDPSDKPEVRFMEVAANQPAAVRTWWYPGRTVGHEFIYPKAQAMRLAGRINQPVLTVASDDTSDAAMRSAELSRINAAGEPVSATASTEVTGTAFPGRVDGDFEVPAPTTAEVAVAERTTRTVATTRTELPRTATFLPLSVLLGLGSLVGAATLRLRRK